MSAPTSHRWTQFSLRSLLGLVVVICLGLGGWHLLFVYGQYVEAEPAVVGQPVKIHGRFFRLFGGDEYGRYELEIRSGGLLDFYSDSLARSSGWGRYDIETSLDPNYFDEPGEYALTLTPEGGTPISGNFVVRGAK
jgi:hypothetical protein